MRKLLVSLLFTSTLTVLAPLPVDGRAQVRVPPVVDYGERQDPDLPGGERYGEDETFTGYPVDPGTPDDNYYDASVEYRRRSPSWTGASYGLGVFGGVGFQYGAAFDERAIGPVFGGNIQNTSGLGVLTMIGSLSYGMFQNSIGGQEVDVNRLDLHASVAIHPMFFDAFGSNRLAYTLGQFYLLSGGNMTFQRTRGGDIDSRFFRPGFHLGAGIDTYLDNVNDGKAFWIGLQYRWNNTAGGRSDDLFRYKWTREHQILVRLTWRFNGSLF